MTRRGRGDWLVAVAPAAAFESPPSSSVISATTSDHVFPEAPSLISPLSSPLSSLSAISSMARVMAALFLAVYLARLAGLSVSPNPGESCATTEASSASARGCSAARSNE